MSAVGEVADPSMGMVKSTAIIRDDDGIITVSSDNSIRVWLKRSNGQYWPSVCHFLTSAGRKIKIDHDSRQVFIGQESGTVQLFELSEDLNVLASKRVFNSHDVPVNDLALCKKKNWIISGGADGTISISEIGSGVKVSDYRCTIVPKNIDIDADSGVLFCGTSEGSIILVRISSDGICSEVNKLQGHTSEITSILWEPKTNFLFSCSSDKTIMCWDIGGKKGLYLRLQGHQDIPISLSFKDMSLYSIGTAGNCICWDMTKQRSAPPEWTESDSCEICKGPFFWNFKQMWEEKTMGKRQHHCRKCGKALCQKCASNQIVMPKLGFEFSPVRVCKSCSESVSDADKTPLAKMTSFNRQCINIEIDHTLSRVATINRNKSISLFNLEF